MQPHALPALLIGATAAFLVSHFAARHSIMTEKIARRGVNVPHSFGPDPMEQTRVADVMADDFQTIPATMKLDVLAGGIADHDPLVSRRQASLILDESGNLAGIITRGDIVRAAATAHGDTTVLEAGATEPIVAHPDESLREAFSKMLRHNVGRLPVVERDQPLRPVGYLGRAELLAGQTSDVREPGWIERAFPKAAES